MGTETCDMRIPTYQNGEWVAGERCGLPAPWEVTDPLDGTVYHFCDDCAGWGR